MLGNTKHEKMFFQKLSEMEPNTEKKTFFRSKVFSKKFITTYWETTNRHNEINIFPLTVRHNKINKALILRKI